ncbi:MAG: DNA-directed RNA polymerase subunit omega [Paludibacteraceae bacterium]|nr:DNA-directed RNA polymerase subunit omega [Paludibacteraceae bacterium]
MARKSNAPVNTITRDMNALCEPVGNVYETVRIIAKRANQIATETKHELDKKLADFQTQGDNLEEVFDNREQIEISRYYEQLPKPTLQAIKEFEDDLIYWKNPTNM